MGAGGWRMRNGAPRERPAQRRCAACVAGQASRSPAGAPPAAAGDEAETPAALAAARLREHKALAQKIDVKSYETVTSVEALDRWIAEAYEAGRVCVDTETSSLDAFDADLVGVSLATAPGRACYIPIRHCKAGSPDDLFRRAASCEGQLPRDLVLAKLKPLLEDPGVLKIAQNMKFDLEILREHGVDVRAGRRHDADVLRARRGQERPRHGRTVRDASRPQADPVRRGRGRRQDVHRLRARGHRQGDRIFRRGRGRDAAAVAKCSSRGSPPRA